MTSMREICRLCMCRDDSMVFIFDEEAIAAKITWVSQLKIFEGDPLPAQICKRCSLRLDSAYYFKEQCISIDRALREMVQHQCSTTLQEVKHPTSDPTLPEGDKYPRQAECLDSSLNSQHIKQEVFENTAVVKEDAILAVNDYVPPKCETSNDSLGVISRAEADPKDSTRLSPVPIAEVTKGFPCPICNKVFLSKPSVKRHISIHSKENTAKLKQKFEEHTQPRPTDNQAKIQLDSSPNLYEELDIKHERLDIPTETTSVIREPVKATFQSPDVNRREERSYQPPNRRSVEATFRSPDFNGREERSYQPPNRRSVEATFRSPDFNGRGERSYQPPNRGPVEATFPSPDFNGGGERSYQPPNRGPVDATFQFPDFNGRVERSYQHPNRGPVDATFQFPDFNGRVERSYQPPNRGPVEAIFPSPDFNGREERLYHPSTRGPGVLSFQSSDFPGREGGPYRPSDTNRSRNELPVETFRSPDFNGRGERSYRPSDFTGRGGGPYRPSDINRSRNGLPMETVQSGDFNSPNVGPTTTIFQSTDHNRPRAGFPMLSTQRSGFNRPNVIIPISNFQSSDFNRPNIGIPTEPARSFNFNSPNVGTIPKQRCRPPEINSSDHRAPVSTNQSSTFKEPKVEIPTRRDLRSSDLEQPDLGVRTDDAQLSDPNRRDVGIPVDTTRPSDMCRSNADVTLETAQDPPVVAAVPLTSSKEDSEPAKKKRRRQRRKPRLERGPKLAFECPFCDEVFLAKSSANRHILGHLQSETDDGPPLTLDEFEPIVLTPVVAKERHFICKICDRRLQSRLGLLSHMRVHTRGNKPGSQRVLT